MADANRLSTQVTSHTVFEENQVLTAQQLNQLTDYLDRQQRLTRARLIGVGIVCGLELQLSNSNVVLAKGVALTTDGDLLNVEQPRKLTQFRKFTDEDAKYPQFRPDGTLLPLYELLEKGGEPLSNFSAATGSDLSGMVAVLYLESYFYDPDLCTGAGCDNKGQEARNNLKLLLVDAENATQLLGDPLLLTRRYPLLAPFKLARVILDPDKVTDYPLLGGEYRTVINSALPELKGVLQKTWQPLIRPLLAGLYGKTDPTLAWGQKLDALLAGAQNNLFGIQYLYDFLLDLAQAYDEFKEALFADNVICVPPVELFPKHLLLGGSGDLSELRHGFYESPQLNQKATAIARLRFLHLRIDKLLRLFQLPAVTTTIRITPSRSKCVGLGGRAIPYYYQPDNKQPLTGYWSFELSQRGLQNGIYNYHAEAQGGSVEAKTPLKYDLYGHDFFRVEGHLGGVVETVEAELKKQIEDNNLPIRLLTLQIETHLKPFRIRPLGPLRDLKVLHRFHRQELLENLGNIRTFTNKVKATVNQAQELPGKDVQAKTLSYKAFIDDGAAELEQAITKVSSDLKVSHSQFKFNDFKLNYESTVQKAAGINKSVRGVTYASAFTPYETLLSDSKFKWLGWIEGILDKRQLRAEELSIFAKFLKEAPAMEHLGGVPKGGTFILVYSGSSKRVVADFCLPYWHVDLPDVEEPEEDAVAENELDWTRWNDFLVQRTDVEELTEAFNGVKAKVDTFDWRLRTQETIADSILVARIDPKVDMGKVFENEALGANAGMLKEMARYMDLIDQRAAAGNATPQEVAMKEKVEEVSSGIINETVKGMQAGAKDVLPGSEEEKFIEVAIANSARMSVAGKQKLSENLVVVQEGAAGKTRMANMLNNMIIKGR
ncbi:MAG TPA: hypothetical protein VIR78_14445 [Malonomonas sp.]